MTFNNFPCACWFLGKNLSNFVSPAWKLDSPYYHKRGNFFKCSLQPVECNVSINLCILNQLNWNVRNNLCILKSLVNFKVICKVCKNIFKSSLQTNFIQLSFYSMYLHTKYIKVFKIKLIRCSNNDLHFDKRCFQSVGRGPFCPNLSHLLPHFGVKEVSG